MIASRSSQLVSYVCFRETEGESADWCDKFFRTLNLDDIPVKPGITPTTFVLKRLSRAKSLELGVVFGQQLSAKQQNEVVAHGLKEVKDWGRDLNFVLKGAGDRERVSDETLDAIYAGELFWELSLAIVRLSSLSPLDE